MALAYVIATDAPREKLIQWLLYLSILISCAILGLSMSVELGRTTLYIAPFSCAYTIGLAARLLILSALERKLRAKMQGNTYDPWSLNTSSFDLTALEAQGPTWRPLTMIGNMYAMVASCFLIVFWLASLILSIVFGNVGEIWDRNEKGSHPEKAPISYTETAVIGIQLVLVSCLVALIVTQRKSVLKAGAVPPAVAATKKRGEGQRLLKLGSGSGRADVIYSEKGEEDTEDAKLLAKS
ncbi:hypothetical protein DFP72DRAFT_870243 [Ephemerocybe angulata]|uniref:Uncharacterized protein n=1 Tax=Ephemerocybe angulata TaxID=980116 RepID=A0A8H6IGP6_9AGAR|nr:hypothetical protein DFP72DRAFT_870243 [Tulosesus angulatus]